MLTFTCMSDPVAQYNHLSERLELPARYLLLREGQVARHTYYLEKGSARIWFNHQGRDITLNFFFEGDGVSSIESFRSGQPSEYSIETIEPCVLYQVSKPDFDFLMQDSPAFKARVEAVTFDTLFMYQKLFLSRIKDSAEARYKELVATRPEIIQRIPQHYIASYLGITPESFSRIKKLR